jgi:CrcB protein
VIGSLILGIITAAVAARRRLAAGPGRGHRVLRCADHDSTFSYETLRLLEDARFFVAANVAASIVAGLCAAFLGVAISKAVWS